MRSIDGVACVGGNRKGCPYGNDVKCRLSCRGGFPCPPDCLVRAVWQATEGDRPYKSNICYLYSTPYRQERQ
ncbi:MAG: hypothetical protein FWB93_02200 [Oscillospiraceae bacterium]|nr:hypothetical protein [Oscillospiraceae bacterium]